MAKRSKEDIAKGLLWQQIDKLKEGAATLPDDAWLAQTASLVKTYFGEDSDAYQAIKKFDNKPYIIRSDAKHIHYKERKERAVNLIKGYIEMIDHQGLYKEPRKRFLARFTEGWQIAIVGIVFTVGLTLGKCTSDYQNVELKQTVSKQADSLSKYKNRIDSLQIKIRNTGKSHPVKQLR